MTPEPKYKLGDRLMHVGTNPDRIKHYLSGSFTMTVLGIRISRIITAGGETQVIAYRCRVSQACGEANFEVIDFEELELVPAPAYSSEKMA